MNYGVLTYLENDRVLRAASLWTAKKPGKVVHDKASYRITPPYEAERPQAKQPLEVASDFNDEQVLETFTRKAIQWIEGAVTNRRPFFVYLPLTSPHKPVCPQPRFEGRSECGAYGDFMVETDHWVGELMRSLTRLGIDDNTMIVFTSDNGPENTYKERIGVYGHRSAGIYRGGKRDRYEGGHRVPFLIRWPAGVPAGTKWDGPVCQSDLLATFCEMVDAKLPPDAGEDSQSFWAAMRGKAAGGAGRVPLVHHSASGHFAIRDGDWKLLLNEAVSGRGKGRKRGAKVFELYNLRRDPGETEEVSAEHPDIVKRLTDRLTAIVQNGRSTPGARQANDRHWWRQLTWLPEP
jgi:arylsulfatase A